MTPTPAPAPAAPPAEPPPGAERALPVVAAAFLSNTGAGGPELAHAGLPFPPGAVRPADLARLTAWDRSQSPPAPVPLAVVDANARHPDGSVRYARVQLERAGGRDGEVPLEFRFDRPVGPGARRPAVPYAAVRQALPALAVDRGAPARLTAAGAGFYWWHDDDRVRRFGPGPVPWGPPYNTKSASDAPPAGDPRMLRVDCILCGTRGGGLQLRAMGGAWTDRFEDASPSWVARYGPEDAQVVGVVSVYVRAGAGTFTAGVTPLDHPMVVGLTLGHASGAGARGRPHALLPTNVPAASVAPTDPAYLCACRLVPWALEPSAATRARGGAFAATDAKLLSACDALYRWRGPSALVFSNAGETAYAPNMLEWMDYARTGRRRSYRRALGVWEGWRARAAELRYDLGAKEAFADLSIPTMHAMLAGDPEPLRLLPQLARSVEWPAVQYEQQGPGTFRIVTRLLQGLWGLHAHGLRGDAGVTIAPEHRRNAWARANAAASGTAARARRVASLLRFWTRPGAGPNARRSRLVSAQSGEQGYGDAGAGGIAPWQMCWLLLWAEVARAEVADAPEFDAVLLATVDYLLHAVKPRGGPLLLDLRPGREQGLYEEEGAAAAAGPPGDVVAELNGMVLSAFPRAAALSPPWAGELRAVADRLYLALRAGSVSYFGKQASEAGFGSLWPPARDAGRAPGD